MPREGGGGGEGRAHEKRNTPHPNTTASMGGDTLKAGRSRSRAPAEEATLRREEAGPPPGGGAGVVGSKSIRFVERSASEGSTSALSSAFPLMQRLARRPPAMSAAGPRAAHRMVRLLSRHAAPAWERLWPASGRPPSDALAVQPARASATAAAATTPLSATFLASSEAATATLADLAGGYSHNATAAGIPPPSPGDAFALRGPVGAGKSAWARAFVRAAAGDPGLAVPSPTYLLHATYEEACEGGRPAVHHFDLYRLEGPGPDRAPSKDAAASSPSSSSLASFDVDRTGLGQALSSGVSVIEWAERLGSGGAGEAARAAGVPIPPAVVEVSLEALSPAGVAALLAGRTVSGSTEGEGDEEDPDDPYTDDRPRAVRLSVPPTSPHPRAAARVAAIAAAVKAGAGGPGLALVE